METESSEEKSRRRAKALKRYAVEFVLAVAFVGAMAIVRPIVKSGDAGFLLRLGAIILPAIVLTFWFGAYVLAVRAMDELEQAMEMRSLAIACGVTIWITTVWGISNIVLQAPLLPLAFVAPLAAVVFGVVRVIIGLRYR